VRQERCRDQHCHCGKLCCLEDYLHNWFSAKKLAFIWGFWEIGFVLGLFLGAPQGQILSQSFVIIGFTFIFGFSEIGFVWVGLGSFFPSPPSVLFFIIHCQYFIYVHLTFSEFGFVLQKKGAICRGFSTVVERRPSWGSRNAESETRNPKQIQITQIQMSQSLVCVDS